MSAAPDIELRLVLPRRSVRQHLVDIWRYRELWQQLVRKELHVRYQKSVLGFAWSMANPLFLLVVYSIVFGILGQSFTWFGIWLLAGILVWNFFSTSLATGTQAITANGYLVGKVNFPREVLPLASVGAAFVHLMLSSVLMVAVLLVTQFSIDWSFIWLVIPAVITLVVLASAFAILLSASNVYARDTTHLLELVLLAWFWLTPIIYPFELVTKKLEDSGHWAYWHLLNPMAPILMAIQRGVYAKTSVMVPDGKGGMESKRLLPDLSQWWYLRNIGVVFIAACVLLVIAVKIFDKAEANFAEVM